MAVLEAVARISGGMDEDARAIAQLPIRYGGLGVLNQFETAPVALGSSFLLSRRVLMDHGYAIGDTLLSQMEPFVKLCATNVAKPVDELLSSEIKCLFSLQRRASEPLHEDRWETVLST